MNIHLIRILTVTFTMCISLHVFAQKNKLKAQVEEAKKQAALSAARPWAELGKPLPPFEVITQNDFIIKNQDIEENQPIILVLFNPNCDHCKTVGTKLVEMVDSLKRSLLFFVAGSNLKPELGTFATATGLIDMDNILVAADQSHMIDSLFESKGIPQIMLYDRNRTLIHKQYSELNADSLMYYIQKL